MAEVEEVPLERSINFKNYVDLWINHLDAAWNHLAQGLWGDLTDLNCLIPEEDAELKPLRNDLDAANSALDAFVDLGRYSNPRMNEGVIFDTFDYESLGRDYPPSVLPALEALIRRHIDAIRAYRESLTHKLHGTLNANKVRREDLSGLSLPRVLARLDADCCVLSRARWALYESQTISGFGEVEDLIKKIEEVPVIASLRNPRSDYHRAFLGLIGRLDRLRGDILDMLDREVHHADEVEVAGLNPDWHLAGQPLLEGKPRSDSAASPMGPDRRRR